MEKWGPTADYLTYQIPEYNFVVIPLDFADVQFGNTQDVVVNAVRDGKGDA